MLITVYMIITVCSSQCHVTILVFVRFLTSLNVSSGSEAVFHCGHPNASAIGWTVNGTIVSNNPDIRLNNNGNTGSLTITARPQYNSTRVQCVTFFVDRSNEISPPADLWIQGNWHIVK